MSVRALFLRPLVLGVTALAVLSGQHAYAASAKTVVFSVDGSGSEIRTHGSTVGDALKAAHLAVGEHDLLSPDATTKLGSHTHVVLRRGRELNLSVDGHTRQVWVTAESVSEALDQIGLRTNGAVLSADRSRGIPLKGFSLAIRTRKTVQVVDAGRVRSVGTNTEQVQQFLHEEKIKLAATDKLSVLRRAPIVDDMVIQITRIHGRQVGQDVVIPFAVEHRDTDDLYTGQHEVVREGQVGLLHRTFALRYINGHLASKKLAAHSVRTQSPISEVIEDGTKARPQPKPKHTQSASSGGLNWAALANCESGGNPRSVSSNGEYRGLYQFSMSTWEGVGGQGDPIDASSSEQTYRAELLYQRDGRSPWPVCGRYL